MNVIRAYTKILVQALIVIFSIFQNICQYSYKTIQQYLEIYFQRGEKER